MLNYWIAIMHVPSELHSLTLQISSCSPLHLKLPVIEMRQRIEKGVYSITWGFRRLR